MKQVGYLGPIGTYTYQCASKIYPEAEYIPFGSISDVFTLGFNCDYSVVPIENSTFGSVQQTLDCLASSENSWIVVQEAFLSISHCLLAKSSEIKISRIYSHPQVAVINQGARAVL